MWLMMTYAHVKAKTVDGGDELSRSVWICGRTAHEYERRGVKWWS